MEAQYIQAALRLTGLVISAAMGALVSILLWFFGIILSSVWMDSQTSNNYTQIEAPLKLLSLFLPPCGCYFTFKLIGFWEQAGSYSAMI